MAIDAAGDVIVTGSFQGTCDFGGVQLTSASGYDAFVLKLDAGGQTKWAKALGGVGYDAGQAVAVTPAGNLVLGIDVELEMDAGCGLIKTGGGKSDVAVVILDPAGGCVYSQRFGDLEYQWVYGVAVSASGGVAVTGSMAATLDFGLGPLTSAGSTDAFLAKLTP